MTEPSSQPARAHETRPPRDTARNLANAALRLAAGCVGVLTAATIPRPAPWLPLYAEARWLLATGATLLIVAAVLMIDWVIDSFRASDWGSIDQLHHELNLRPHSDRFNYFFARMRLFGGGFAALAGALALLMFAAVWLVGLQASSNSVLGQGLALCAATGAALLVFVKLLTRRLRPALWGVLLLAVAALALTANFL